MTKEGLSRRDFLLAGGAGLLTLGMTSSETFPDNRERFSYLADNLPPQHLISSLEAEKYYRPAQISKAADFIFRHRVPNGVFLTDLSKREVVPMDNAHAALALSKMGYVEEAKQAVSGILGLLTKPGEGNVVTKDAFGKKVLDYSGSWWNEYKETGEKTSSASRGRTEQNGLMMMAIEAICLTDPDFFVSSVDERSVADCVWEMASYIKRRQQADGGVEHNPLYALRFPEENVRIAEGLKLMSARFMARGEIQKAGVTQEMASNTFAALTQGKNYNYGMSYDFLAKAMWGVEGQKAARSEVLEAVKMGKLNSTGVKMYDQKQEGLSYLEKSRVLMKQKWSGEVYGVAESIEGIIALMHAGWITEAERQEQAMSKLQQADGGFPTFFFGPLAGGSETIFTAARYILMERQITEIKKQKYAPLKIAV